MWIGFFFTCGHWFLGGETVQVRPTLNSTSSLYSFFQLDITQGSVICLVDICIRTNWGWGVDVFGGCSPNPPATSCGRCRHLCSCFHLQEAQTATSSRRALEHHLTDKVASTHGCYTLYCNHQPLICTSPAPTLFHCHVCTLQFSKTFCILRSFQPIQPLLLFLLWIYFLPQHLC